MCQKHLNFLRTPYLMGSPTISCCLWPGCSVSMHTVLCTWFWKRENLQLSPDVLLLLLLWNHIMLCSLFIQHSINTQFIIISHLQRTNPSKRSKVTPEIFFFVWGWEAHLPDTAPSDIPRKLPATTSYPASIVTVFPNTSEICFLQLALCFFLNSSHSLFVIEIY